MLKRLLLMILLCAAVLLLLNLMTTGQTEDARPLPAGFVRTVMMPVRRAAELFESYEKPTLFGLLGMGFMLLFAARPGLVQWVLWPRAPHAQVRYYAFHFSDRAG